MDALDPRSIRDLPIYARTPHGTYRFVIQEVTVENTGEETVAMLVLREVEQG